MLFVDSSDCSALFYSDSREEIAHDEAITMFGGFSVGVLRGFPARAAARAACRRFLPIKAFAEERGMGGVRVDLETDADLRREGHFGGGGDQSSVGKVMND